MFDAAELIRARYLASDPASGLLTLKQLTSRQFEVLVFRLYSAMGYQCHLTAERNDGGETSSPPPSMRADGTAFLSNANAMRERCA
jgi:hypothetical protein